MILYGGTHLDIKRLHCSLSYHCYTIWLFTFSDLKTIMIPTTFFGLVGALSGQPMLSASLSPSAITSRALHVLFWTWSTLLPFDINNQCQGPAITEDSYNKSWRPLPSKRISPKIATLLMMCLYAENMLISIYMGVFWQALSLLCLGTWYNRLGGADRSCIERNIINAGGYVSFITGALTVAINKQDSDAEFGPIARSWFLCVGLIIFTTVHTQDFEDVDGDTARGRETVPLAFGDDVARGIVTLAVPFWSLLMPCYFQSQLLGYLCPFILGTIVSFRIFTKRKVEDDRLTFRLWNLWIISLYTIPFYITV
jgi:4-hydroxybenzoate polyprenyltransferase